MKQSTFRLSFVALFISLIIVIISSCETEIKQEGISNISGYNFKSIVERSIENDTVFFRNEIVWDKLSYYTMEEGGYFITVPAISETGIVKGKIVFEVFEKNISKKYIVFSLSPATIDSISKGIDLSTHDVLNFLQQRNRTPILKSLYPPSCMGCHSGVSAVGGNFIEEVVVTPETDPWDSEFDDSDVIGGGTVVIGDISNDNDVTDPQADFCEAYNGVLNLSSIKNNLDKLTLSQEQFIIGLANLAAFSELNLFSNDLQKDLTNYSPSSSLYSKLNRLQNYEKYTNGWKEVYNSSANSDIALQSGEIGNSDFCLKYYPEKNGENDAIGLVKAGNLSHGVEGALELIEYLVVSNSDFEDDFLYDMHLYNAVNFMEDYCDE